MFYQQTRKREQAWWNHPLMKIQVHLKFLYLQTHIWRQLYLSSDHDSPGYKGLVGVALEAVVQGDDVEAVQKLSLVLVDPLDVDVKDGGRVDLYVVVLLDVLRQLHLVFLVMKMKTISSTI